MKNDNTFWNWFKENEAKYFFLNHIDDEDERERLLDDFLQHLHQYCDNLYFEIGGLPDEKQDLIITAAGNEDFFNEVDTLVENAPSLKYWNVIALKPAIGEGVVKYKEVELDPKKMYFMPLENDSSKKIGLRVYEAKYDSNKEDDFMNCLYLILDNLLGERSSSQEIGYLEIQPLTSKIETDDLIQLIDLPKYVRWKRSKI